MHARRASASLVPICPVARDLHAAARAGTRAGRARRIRAELSILVEQAGGKTTVDGFGRLEAVILKLIDAGQYHVADAIRSCKQESARPGTLRVLRDLR